MDELRARVTFLEKILTTLEPTVNLDLLPRTADHARIMANALRRTRTYQVRPPESNTITSALVQSGSNGYCETSKPEAYPSLAGLDRGHNPSSSHLGLLGSRPFPDVRQAGSAGEALVQLDLPQPLPSVAECSFRCGFERLIGLHGSSPDEALANSLVTLYFEHVHPFHQIIHQDEFMRHYRLGPQTRDKSFKILCSAVFAEALRFSSDSKILQHPFLVDEGEPQSAGATFAEEATSHLMLSTGPCNLFDLQAMALISYYTLAMCSPFTAWNLAVIFMRRGRLICRYLSLLIHLGVADRDSIDALQLRNF